jgi:UDP-glucose 4-epimerase
VVNITVLGADGFIGKHLVRALAQQPDNMVCAFDRFADFLKEADNPFAEFDNVTVIPGDFLNEYDIAQAVKNSDYVFHLISTTNPATANKAPLVDLDTNVRGSIELFRICAEQAVKKIIFPSSGGTIYGNVDSRAIDEATLPAPLSPYGIAKLTIEHYLRYFKNTAGMDYVVYRIANPYGPGQNIYGKQGVIPIFLHKFLMKEPLTIYGDGDMVRDYIYIDDLIEMMVGSYDKDNRYPEYNLGSGQGHSVNDIVAAIETCTKSSVQKTHLPTPATFVRTSVLNNARFIDEFGIVPHTTLKEGIARTWNYVKKLD